MHRYAIGLVLLLCANGCCLPPGPAQADRRATSGVPTSHYAMHGLGFWIAGSQPNGVAGSPLLIPICVSRTEGSNAARPLSLLAGRFIATFIPVNGGPDGPVHSHHVGFSGAGGVDYTGQSPTTITVSAPSVPGSYWLHLTVHSTPDDVRRFKQTAKIYGGGGPWWTGCSSTLPRRVLIAAATPPIVDPDR